MITDFRGRQTAEQQILRCNGFILIVPRNQYQATLISHSQRKSPTICKCWCVITHFSISSSTLYSPVSYSKHNSSHPKDCFTHESFWMPFPSVCYLVPCFDISLYGHSAPVLISGKVITVARAKFPPQAFSFLVFVQSTNHHTYTHDSPACLLSIPPTNHFAGPQPVNTEHW